MTPNAAILAADLRQEAAEARDLASTLEDQAAIADLLNYARALESEAADCEGGSVSGVVQLEREKRESRPSMAAGEKLQRHGRR
jgi:hypothetical protein